MVAPGGKKGVNASPIAGVVAILPPVGAQKGLYKAAVGCPHPQPAKGRAVFVVGGGREGEGRTGLAPPVAMVTGLGGREEEGKLRGRSSCSEDNV